MITKADATVSVTGYTGVYDGDAHGATGSATGVGGVALSGLVLGDSFTNVPGGTATWTFTDTTGNYNNASGVGRHRDHQGGRDGDGDGLHRRLMTARRTARPARRRAWRRGAERPGPRGQLHERARRHGDLDLHGHDRQLQQRAAASVAIVITKADATVSVTGYTGVYDAAAHGATGTATGVGGEALSGLVLGDSFTNVPGGTANWTFTDTTGNYNNASGVGRHRDHEGGRDGQRHRLHRRV